MDRGGPPQSATNEPSSPGEEALQPAGAPQPLCILAGSGTLPGEIADSVVGTGGTVHIVGLRGVASDDIARHPHSWTGLGQVARMLRLMRASGAGRLLIVGGLQRPNLWHLRPDLGFIAHFKTIAGIMRGGDDAVLRRVIRFFEAQGLEVVGVPDVAPEVVVGRDLSIGAAPTDSDPAGTPVPTPAIATATRLIRALADFDIGQGAIAVPEGVIGIEDGGGTARLIVGARGIGDREAVLVKMTKAGQETRVDLPTAGPDTIAQARTVGLSGIALEAGRSLIAERKRTMRD
ncbi:MAG: UDP-2,3-diacylglucosamine diphosphatase LpxI, partial [Pseudomonadota bacterium]